MGKIMNNVIKYTWVHLSVFFILFLLTLSFSDMFCLKLVYGTDLF